MRGWTKTIVDTVAIVLIILAAKTAIAEPYYIPSGSMEPTLQIGDELLAMKYPYGYSAASLPPFINLPDTQRILAALPERGDIVVFRWPGDRSQIWVKRVVGLPGDRVAMRGGRLWINGGPVEITPDGIGELEAEDGSLQSAARYIETLPGDSSHTIFKHAGGGAADDMAEIVIPADHLFVMGDNRDNSADSRIAVAAGGVGLLPTTDLVGRVDALVGSWDLAVRRQPIWTWPAGLRLSRFFTTVQ
jgi:signal peptidase I